MVVYSEGRNVRPVPLYKQRKQGQFVPPRWLLLLHLQETPPLPLLLEAERAALRPPLPPASPTPSTSPTTSAMAPKADKGKGVKSAEALVILVAMGGGALLSRLREEGGERGRFVKME